MSLNLLVNIFLVKLNSLALIYFLKPFKSAFMSEAVLSIALLRVNKKCFFFQNLEGINFRIFFNTVSYRLERLRKYNRL